MTQRNTLPTDAQQPHELPTALYTSAWHQVVQNDPQSNSGPHAGLAQPQVCSNHPATCAINAVSGEIKTDGKWAIMPTHT